MQEIEDIVKMKMLEYYDDIKYIPYLDYMNINGEAYHYNGIALTGIISPRHKPLPINFGLYGKMLDISLDECMVYRPELLQIFLHNLLSSHIMVEAINNNYIILQIGTMQKRPNIALHNLINDILFSLTIDVTKIKMNFIYNK